MFYFCLVIGAIAGWTTGLLLHNGNFGATMDVALGIIGALLACGILRLLGFPSTRQALIYHILVTIGGAALLTMAVHAAPGIHDSNPPTTHRAALPPNLFPRG